VIFVGLIIKRLLSQGVFPIIFPPFVHPKVHQWAARMVTVFGLKVVVLGFTERCGDALGAETRPGLPKSKQSHLPTSFAIHFQELTWQNPLVNEPEANRKWTRSEDVSPIFKMVKFFQLVML